MSWQSAFLAQARSDNEVRKLLNRYQVPYSHQLHYLQMVAEKLSKSLMIPPGATTSPRFSHAAFVSCLRALKGRPEVRRKLGYSHVSIFSAFVDSVLPFAEQVEKLAPTFAGETKPNPEYPWQPPNTHEVIVPADFDFPELGPANLKIILLIDLINKLLDVAI
jgi:hypothetical protein